MLSESLQELLSAYVDGELSPTEYDRVLAALRESALARDYVQSLRSMQGRLKALPKVSCPPQVTADILKQEKNRLRAARYQRLAWGISLAASLLIGLGVAWQYLGNQQVQNTVASRPEIADNLPVKPQPPLNPPNVPQTPVLQWAMIQPYLENVAGYASDLNTALQSRFRDSLAWFIEADTLLEGRFLESQPSLLSSPVKSSGALFKTIDATLPLQVNPPDFAWNEFEERLQRKGALVLDISVRNHAKALTRLMETAGFPIAMDEQLQPVLAGKNSSTTMLYVDTITVELVKEWLERLKLADYWNVPEYRSDGVCRSLLLYTLEGTGQRQLAYSFGLSKWSELPADPAAKQAIALVYQPNRKTTSFSREMFRHISQLHGPRPDKLTLIIMVRAEK